MALVHVDVEPSQGPLPERVAAFVRAANERIDAFFEERWKDPIVAFVPSDLALTWRVLDAIGRAKLAPGPVFCEWGCGFAAVAGLAALAGFQACGIEIERPLLEQARRLAGDFELNVDLVHGNFVPDDAGELADCANEFSWLAEGGPDGHEALELDPDDFDVVFAYPWPGEEEVILRLFDAYAAEQALLVTFRGMEGLRVQRKVSAGRPASIPRFDSRPGRRGRNDPPRREQGAR